MLRGKQDFVAKCRHLLNQMTVFFNELDSSKIKNLEIADIQQAFQHTIENIKNIVSSNHIILIFEQTEANRSLLLSGNIKTHTRVIDITYFLNFIA